MIKLSNISKSYGDKKVIENFSYNFENKNYAIMGPSGCGKTTLVHIIAGLTKQDTGEITGNNKISFVFQEDRLINHLTCLENLTLVNNDVNTCKNILIGLKLEEYINEKPTKLSGGMQRRVSIGRALAYPHNTLIMDEAFKGLDKDTKKYVIDYLKTKLENKTLILITHHLDEALSLNCEIINLKNENNSIYED